MSIEQLGYGAGGGLISGIIGSILVAMGIRDRVKNLEDNKLGKDVFLEYREGVTRQLESICDKIDRMDIKLDMILKK